jgi:predicted anti-sigma-YlaC factor YlaD
MSEHIGELLSLYIDDEVGEDEKNRIEKHLAQCQQCQNDFLELTMLKNQMYAEFQFIDIPDNIEDQVMAKISKTILVKHSQTVNRTAPFVLIAFGILFMVATGPFLTLGLHIFHTFFSIGRGLIYAIPSILSAIPYVLEVLSIVILVLIILAIIALKFLVHTIGKTVRTGDL